MVHHLWRSSGFCVDPVEKSRSATSTQDEHPSFGTAGCNRVQVLQNWDISKSNEMDRLRIGLARAIAGGDQARLQVFAFPYNDPVIFAGTRWTSPTPAMRRTQAVAVTAGYMHDAPRLVLRQDGRGQRRPEGLHRRLLLRSAAAGCSRCSTRSSIVRRRACGPITTLLIPGRTIPTRAEAQCRWIKANLGPGVPLHFSAFHPTGRCATSRARPRRCDARERSRSSPA